jgi:hypothetical protein
MARTALTVQSVTETGIIPSYAAANVDGHSVPPGAILHVKNGSGVSINVTIQTGATSAGRAIADDVVAVGAGAEKMILLQNRALLARQDAPDRGKVYVDFSAVTTVTIAALGHDAIF